MMVLWLTALAFGGDVQPGDVVLHRSRSAQSEFLAKATNSPWTHSGVVFDGPEGLVVFEAVQPVRTTPLRAWADRSADDRIAILRLKDASTVLTDATLARMQQIGVKWLGKSYDAAFSWSDDAMYCSELVYKLFNEGAGVQVATLRTFGSFDRSDPAVAKAITARWGAHPPLDETVVAPADFVGHSAWQTVCEGPVSSCL